MRLPKITKVVFPKDIQPLKKIARVSPGLAIHDKVWTGFGAGAGVLGYEDIDSVKDTGNLPNVEEVGFVGSLFGPESEDDDEGAE